MEQANSEILSSLGDQSPNNSNVQSGHPTPSESQTHASSYNETISIGSPQTTIDDFEDESNSPSSFPSLPLRGNDLLTDAVSSEIWSENLSLSQDDKFILANRRPLTPSIICEALQIIKSENDNFAGLQKLSSIAKYVGDGNPFFYSNNGFEVGREHKKPLLHYLQPFLRKRRGGVI